MKTRYAHGGDEHIFVELDEEMSLEAFFKGLSMANKVRELNIDGVTEVCPANASLQVKFDPDVISPHEMLSKLKEIEYSAEHSDTLDTRIIEIPVYYQDPWTHECLMKFRDRHQDPNCTDLEYAARINGYETVEELIEAHSGSPWFVSMVGFVAGLPWLYQMVERSKQIEVPKYLRPRTDTPKQTIGYGGCFSALYSVRGAGGYQMFGITPMPIYDPRQEVKHLQDFMILAKPGDIVKFRSIQREEYDRILAQVEAREYDPRIRPVKFSLDEFNKDIDGCNKKFLEVLNDN